MSKYKYNNGMIEREGWKRETRKEEEKNIEYVDERRMKERD